MQFPASSIGNPGIQSYGGISGPESRPEHVAGAQEVDFGNMTYFPHRTETFQPGMTLDNVVLIDYACYNCTKQKVRCSPTPQRPCQKQPYHRLIECAFKSAQSNILTLGEIYAWFEQNTKKAWSGVDWRKAVRATLSENRVCALFLLLNYS